jgi:hypothetical protein
MDVTDIYKILHPAATEYTLFLAAHGTFSKMHHTLGHKASLKYKDMEITSCISPEYNGTTRSQHQRNHRKHSNTWR